MALVTYPLNNIEYSAEDAELFHVTRTSGIYANESFSYSVAGADNTIVIGTGVGWIKNSEFSGKVIALKDPISLDVGLPDSVYPRIDAIVIQFDANSNATNIVVKQGTASSSPVAPSVVRTESVYELHLYHVWRDAGSLYITQNNITDLRINKLYCGLMADSVTSIDTTAINKQVSELVEYLKSKISNVENGSAYLFRDGSNTMTNNLAMDGYKVTELATPTDAQDAVNKTYVDTNFAPAGHVDERGQYTDYTSALAQIKSVFASMGDQTKRCLFIDILNLDSTNFPKGSYFVEIYREWETYGTIVFTSSAYIKIVIRIAGSWGDFCYENPPMVVGVEYRTTERYNGAPVYTKMIKFGTLFSSGVASVPTGLSNVTYISYNLRIPDFATEVVSGTAMFSESKVAAYAWIDTTTNEIKIRSSQDCSNYQAFVTIKYCKN